MIELLIELPLESPTEPTAGTLSGSPVGRSTERPRPRPVGHRSDDADIAAFDVATMAAPTGTIIPSGMADRSTLAPMAQVRLFAAARDVAGTGRVELPGATVDDVLGAATDRFGERFAAVLSTCKIWVNGEPAAGSDAIGAADELAVLPPVSGG